MKHIVLLGDSVFDNSAYVSSGLDVCSQLQPMLSADWRATLLAVDGSSTDDVAEQIKNLPHDCTHIIVSVGGNDALDRMSVLYTSVGSMSEAVALMTITTTDFSQHYDAMLQILFSHGLPLTLCTIYYPRLSKLDQRQATITALALYNDCIIRAAVLKRLPLLDLRFICTEDADFIHEIEPSAVGGAKIAAAIQRHVTTYDKSVTRTQIFI